MSEGVIYPKKHSPKLLVGSMANLTHRTAAGAIPDAIAELYGINKASPVATPTFVFMVGSPGAGKSQGHAALLEGAEPIFKSYNYAIINLDTLLESFVPFRIASAFGHSVKSCLAEKYPKGKGNKEGKPSTKRFSSISCYSSKKGNLGAFSFLEHEETRTELLRALTDEMAEKIGKPAAETYITELFADIEATGAELKKAVAAVSTSLLDLNAEAIDYAIRKHINIVYETTFSSMKKFDDLYGKLKAAGYKIVVFHVTDTEEHIKAKLISRQEYEMPYQELPFYRYVAPSDKLILEFIKSTGDVVTEIAAKTGAGEKYAGVDVRNLAVSFDPSRLAKPVAFNFESQIERIRRAYGIGSRRESASAAGCAATAGCAAAAGTKYGGRRGRRHRVTRRRDRKHR